MVTVTFNRDVLKLTSVGSHTFIHKHFSLVACSDFKASHTKNAFIAQLSSG